MHKSARLWFASQAVEIKNDTIQERDRIQLRMVHGSANSGERIKTGKLNFEWWKEQNLGFFCILFLLRFCGDEEFIFI